ncbi:PorP/SprF family type IX secretion system membrane protein [Polaribacter cellanae]|uniref:PorP/SprF family type IX secretion system membrane protein n=1 Tax=Polaribacter cellanae TaxID=2818493 RepID=A0A975CQS5_9FLAO|nr:PorP/SprF family type IX secretion system membrane protein [Polaribacter cellanae]QTE21491.1 PorP/SprF family type IX secretion system membrane protein [Polaribacter cellanae]
MFKTKLLLTLLLISVSSIIFSQSNNEQLFNNFSSHNFLKHNRFFLNPTFSVARENTTYLSFLSRNKFSDFDDSPQLYVGSYSGRISEKVGVGLGVFQQNFGVFKHFGVLLNYGYQVRLSEKNALAFGFNFMYSRSGIDRNKILVNNPDPFLANFQERPLINFQPAVNLTLGSFDVGIFLENLIDYDLKAYEFITEFPDKTFSGHLMYTKQFTSETGMFKDGKLQLLSIVRKPGKNNTEFTGSLLLDLPKIGWIQSTYDHFYGTSIGVGVNISERISIGFVYEKGKNNLGITNEIGLTYNFGKHDYAKININGSSNLNTLEASISKLEENNKNKKEVNELMNSYKIRQDSINKAQKLEAEKKHLQVLKLIKSNQQNKTVEIVTNKKKEKAVAKRIISKKKSVEKAKNQEKPKKVIPKKITPKKTISKKTLTKKENIVARKQLVSNSKIKIPTKNLNGYFVIANYFSKEKNAIAFTKTMQKKGFDSKYFKHPRKNYYYVYLDSFRTNIEAQQAIDSKLNNRYTALLSVVKVNNNRVGKVLGNTSTKKTSFKKPVKKYKATKINKKPVKIKKMKSSKGLEPGYYLIVNVFSKKYYANKFLKKMEEDNLNPQFFIYPKNNYRYVYLSKKQTKKEILELYYSNINGNYTNDKWIMHIE